MAFDQSFLLALRAIALGAAIDDVVLWAVPDRGRAFTRELRAFARMEDGLLVAADQARDDRVVPEGWLVAGGYALSAQTRADVDALDVAELALPGAADRRALLLGRDGVAPSARLIEALQAQGVGVEVDPGHGFGLMLVEPQFARLPETVLRRVAAFVAAEGPGAVTTAPPPPRAPRATPEAEVQGAGGVAVRERFAEAETPTGRLFGIVCEPLAAPAEPGLAVLFLGGTGHRIGPNRMWTEAARRWAAHGVVTCRVDIGGAGEASTPTPPDVPGLYTEALVDEARAALGLLPAPQTGEQRRVLVVGLCSGAYWAVRLALEPALGVAPVALNAPTLEWELGEHRQRMARHYRRQLLTRAGWRRLRSGGLSLTRVRRIARVLLARGRRGGGGGGEDAGAGSSAQGDATAAVLDCFRDQGTPAWLLFAGREALYDALAQRTDRAAQWPTLHVETVGAESDLHTLRPLWVQRALHERLDTALAAERSRDAAPVEAR